jgi:hypothetical protein
MFEQAGANSLADPIHNRVLRSVRVAAKKITVR